VSDVHPSHLKYTRDSGNVGRDVSDGQWEQSNISRDSGNVGRDVSDIHWEQFNLIVPAGIIPLFSQIIHIFILDTKSLDCLFLKDILTYNLVYKFKT
jgi:hypothetical protein